MLFVSWKTLKNFGRLFLDKNAKKTLKAESQTGLNDRRQFLSQIAASFYVALSFSILKVELAWAAIALVKGVRLWRSPDKTRLVFDVSTDVSHSAFSLSNPRRLVLDIKGAQLGTTLSSLQLKNTPIRSVRHGIHNKENLRLVLDLNQQVTAKSFQLKPNATYGHRLVVDLFDDNKNSVPVVQKQKGWRDIIVAIDAGHGGEDPGAIAHGGGYEKHVTLAIAQKLAALLKQTPGFTPVLIRDDDYYVELRQRTKIARDNNADLFISIHADGFQDTRAKGASVFALSRSGASSETARWLAQKENMSDQIGGEDGISLSDKDDLLAGVLLDLSMTSTLSSSLEVGDKILQNVGAINTLHKKRVEQAGFVVLKSPDIPSVLVETGFITNPEESKQLKSTAYQMQIASSIFKGLESWFVKRPPPDTLIAKWKQENKLNVKPSRYVVQPGDTLSEIADQFEINLGLLKKRNKMSRTNLVRVGQVLVIPH